MTLVEFSEHLQVLWQHVEVLNGVQRADWPEGPPLAEVVMIKSTVEAHPGHRGRSVIGLVRVLLYCCISGSETHLFRSEKGAWGKDDINTLAALKSVRAKFAGSVLFGADQQTASMVKCVVSGCPNRIMSSENRGIFNRPPKRFFKFPKDPARVKVNEPEPISDQILSLTANWLYEL